MPRSWVAFWGQFCRIDEDESMRVEDKFQYLLKDLWIEVYIRDLLALVNSKTNLKLSDLYDKRSYLRALETLGVTTSNYAAMLHKVEPTAATLIANSAGKNKNQDCQKISNMSYDDRK
ncbi:transposable element Tc1 transposase [Caerostris extrusa]|uniref:Transposable element Tc1 transposase n=1 Tax=Caerostris extrusa TaxID=172846 RepID=A0AAV4X3N0_CAEEX|nr:transposable element Tc1 transposase [Caerostris extrusa]